MEKSVLFLLIVLFISVLVVHLYIKNPTIPIETFDAATDDLRIVDEGDSNIQIVVARYKENISWIEDPPFNKYKVTCYNKGDNVPQCNAPKCTVLPLTNIGRCDHTYLYHIINNYDNLANVTIFLPGSCLDLHKIKTTFKLMFLVDKTQTTVLLGKPYENVRKELGRLFINKHIATNVVNKTANPENLLLPCPIRPFGRWYDAMFGTDVISKVVCYFGMFAVAKEHILQHPKEHYEKLIKFVDTHSNPEAGHYMERSWGAVFAPIPDQCIHSAMDVYPDYFNSPGFEKY
jgi:hypothetical protein